MNDYALAQAKDFLETMENAVSSLPEKEKDKVYMACAEYCMKNGGVLEEQRRMFEECGRDIDEQYRRYPKTEFFFCNIIESGHIYEFGYPRCLCPMAAEGLVKSTEHCECSRQSILYVLKNLLPDKEIRVEAVETVMSGSDKCRFRIYM